MRTNPNNMFTLETLKAQRQQFVAKHQQLSTELIKLEGAVGFLDSMIAVAEQAQKPAPPIPEPVTENGTAH